MRSQSSCLPQLVESRSLKYPADGLRTGSIEPSEIIQFQACDCLGLASVPAFID